MNMSLGATLKGRFTFLILLAFAPAFLLVGFNAYEEMQAQEAMVRHEALRLVRVMKVGHSQMLEDSKEFLTAVSRFSALRGNRAKQCAFLMDDLAQNFPGYSDFGLAAVDGSVLCSTAPPTKLINNVASFPFFRQALATRRLATGPYLVDKSDSKPTVYMGIPIFGEGKSVSGIVFSAIDLSGFDQLPSATQLPRDSVIVVFDQTGLVLARYPDPQNWTGTLLADAPMVRTIRTGGTEEGVADLMSADGMLRMFAFTKLHRSDKQVVFLTIGVPVDDAYGAARRMFQVHMLSLAAVSVLVLTIAWIGSHRLVVRKMRSLIQAAERIRGGDFAARTGLRKSQDEVGQLAMAIDSMAYSIQSRVDALQRHTMEMSELKNMNDALQACMTQDELFAVVRQFALRLFQAQPGALYLMHPSGDCLEVKASWHNPAARTEFLPLDCWAVRRAKAYRLDMGADQPRCQHVHEPLPLSYLCVPLMVQGELLGILHLQNDDLMIAAAEAARNQFLAEAVAEHISLTLANLRLRETLHAQAMRDGLTGLFNRRYMEETLVRETRNAERNKTDIAIIMLDIDHFKRFNDNFGHAAGDALLRELAKMLQDKIRGGDLACRYGGEEFTIILPHTALMHAADIARQLLESARHLHVEINGQSVGEITISLGVASFPQHGENWAAVLHAADVALLHAKRTRNSVVVFEIGHASGMHEWTETAQP